MKRGLKTYSIRLAGILFIVLGIAGLFLPFLQGILFLILGVYLLTLGHPEAHANIRAYLKRVPSLLKIFDLCDRKVRRFLNIPD